MPKNVLSARELDIFRRIMESGTVTSAAEALNISQPAVSRTLQQAEARLGFLLFIRESKRLIPTAEARALLPDTVTAFAALAKVEQLALDLRRGSGGILRVAAASSFARAALPAAIQRLRRTRPNISVTLDAMSALQVAECVAQHRTDIGFVFESISVPGVSIRKLCTIPLGCVLHRDHPLSSRSSISPLELESETLICPRRELPVGRLVMRAFAESNASLNISIEVSQSSLAAALVREGAGVALIDRLIARDGNVVFRPLAPNVAIDCFVIQPRHTPTTVLAAMLLDEVTHLIESFPKD